MINEERLVNKFFEYVKIDSESFNEKEMAETLIKEMKELGMKVQTDTAGESIGSNANNVYGYLDGDLNIEPILFCAHMDTVKPGKGIKPIIKDEVIYSSGDTILAGDDKAGVSSILEAIRTIKDKNLSHGPIEVVFTILEEEGLYGSKGVEYEKLASKKGFIVDSSKEVGAAITKAPAESQITVKIKGKSSHAGVEPENGISAIQVAADAISNMKLLRIDEETTANIGVITGGEATNVVCPYVEIKAEARSLNMDKLNAQIEHMKECFEKASEKFGAEVDVQSELSYKNYVINEDDEILEIIKEACDKIGITFKSESTGGGSDVNVFSSKGIKTVNLGTGMSKDHTTEEYIKIRDLVNTSKLLLQIMLRDNRVISDAN